MEEEEEEECYSSTAPCLTRGAEAGGGRARRRLAAAAAAGAGRRCRRVSRSPRAAPQAYTAAAGSAFNLSTLIAGPPCETWRAGCAGRQVAARGSSGSQQVPRGRARRILLATWCHAIRCRVVAADQGEHGSRGGADGKRHGGTTSSPQTRMKPRGCGAAAVASVGGVSGGAAGRQRTPYRVVVPTKARWRRDMDAG